MSCTLAGLLELVIYLLHRQAHNFCSNIDFVVPSSRHDFFCKQDYSPGLIEKIPYYAPSHPEEVI